MMTLLKQASILNLPSLKQLDVSGICLLLHVLKAAPNLDELSIDFDFLKILINDQSICDLLQKQIIRLEVRHWTVIVWYLFERSICVFRRLRYLYLSLKSLGISTESILTTIFAHLNTKQLNMLTVWITVSDQFNKNLRQWVVDHTHLKANDLFAIGAIDNCFILWK